jgi:acetone carboxylase gamma subunit
MVEFCGSCGTSLPKGDLTIKKGKLFTSGDYVCPTCGKLANAKAEEHVHEVEPDMDKDIVIKKGKASNE